MTGRLHVVGAGLAGLACAVAAARSGFDVSLHEAAPQAGGRCRSFVDRGLDRLVDNGCHLLIGANRTALAFAQIIGGIETLSPCDPAIPFMDLRSGEKWELRGSHLPSGMAETIAALGLPWVSSRETVAARLGPAPSYERLWKPLCVAALNTAPEDASARMLGHVLRAAMMSGPEGLRPWTFTAGLSAAFAAPALATLAVHGGRFFPRRRLTALADRLLVFDDCEIPLGAEDRVVLALPPWTLSGLMDGIPNLTAHTIVNVHFRLPHGLAMLPPFLGLCGGTAEWVFVRGDVVSATISAADHLSMTPAHEIAERVWRDVSAALGLSAVLPPFRVLKERRATMAHTPDSIRHRPGPQTKVAGVYLAGDWLQSRWPSTIESAVASGLAAAQLATGRRDISFSR